MMYIGNFEKSTKNLLESIQEFIKAMKYKLNTQNKFHFYITNKETDKYKY